MQRVLTSGPFTIWHDTATGEFYAYQSTRLLRVCPSLGLARAVIAKAEGH